MTTTTRRRTTPAATSSDWHHRAACSDADPDLFFPVGTTGLALVQIEAAKRVCGACPVRAECLDWALETGQRSGVWGGLTESERADLLRKRTPKTRTEFVEKARKPRRPAVEMVLDRYSRVVELRGAGWGRRRLAADLGVSAESVVAAERLVAEVGSVQAALDSLAVTA